jgi:hypothetical protein
MAQMDEQEFKFPDEIEEKAPKAEAEEAGFEIEVEDDTPEEDRGRQPMPKQLVENLEKDELETYDEEVKSKLKQMRKVWHDERREKEAALREQQEAIAVAKRLMEENKRIKGILSSGEKEYVASIQNSANLELEMAKRAFKEAYESGDADQVADAQQKMQEATLRAMQAKSFKAPSLQEQEVPVQPEFEQRPQVPQPDRRALAWQERNKWFGQDEEMTAAALGLHEKLRRNGVVVGSDEYYDALDKTMRRRFPEELGSEEESKPEVKQPARKPAAVVAPAVRSTASNKVRLKTSQMALIKKLGITPEQYVKEFVKESQNG